MGCNYDLWLSLHGILEVYIHTWVRQGLRQILAKNALFVIFLLGLWASFSDVCDGFVRLSKRKRLRPLLP